MKRCSSCKLNLPRSSFHADSSKPDGHHYQCIDCRRGSTPPKRPPRPPLEPLGGWRDRAVCVDADPEIFFPDKGGSIVEAKRVCAGCPVASECLAFAAELMPPPARYQLRVTVTCPDHGTVFQASDPMPADPRVWAGTVRRVQQAVHEALTGCTRFCAAQAHKVGRPGEQRSGEPQNTGAAA